MFQNVKVWGKGQGGQSFDLKLAKSYVLCYGSCKLSFDMLQPYNISNCSTNYSWGQNKVRGQIMVMRGHMAKNSKKMSHMICMGAQLSFDMHQAYAPNR